jgi:predicted negative regulator of RcsB-dependent stress response
MAQQSLSSEDPRIIDSGEVFLSKNLYPLILCLIVALALACAGVWWFAQKQKQNDAAQELFLKAQTTEDFSKIVQSYPQSPAAALAHLSLAQKAVAEKNFEAAVGHYESFLKNFKDHPATGPSEWARAVCLENSGKKDLARDAYQKMISSKSGNGFVGLASMGLARLYLQDNNLLAARQTLSDFISSNEEVGIGNQAREMLNSLPPSTK